MKGSLDQRAMRERIAELKRRAQEIAGESFAFAELEEVPLEIRLQYWENIVAFEEAPRCELFAKLVESGVSLPSPEEMEDARIGAKLLEIAEILAEWQVFLESTDHLSDRELYRHLWTETLREEIVLTPHDPHSAWHLDMIGSGSEEDVQVFLQYYANDEVRASWARDFPEQDLPPRLPLPCDRDRSLPKPR